jgi:hypothetical protein
MLKSLLMSALLAAAAATPALAQPTVLPGMVDATNPELIRELAAEHGGATLEETGTDDPVIRGDTGGVPYTIYFHTCTEHAACEDIRFYSVFIGNKQAFEVVNSWNRDKRYGKAYLNGDLDAVLEMDVNLLGGVRRGNLQASFDIWVRVLDSFAVEIGAK